MNPPATVPLPPVCAPGAQCCPPGPAVPQHGAVPTPGHHRHPPPGADGSSCPRGRARFLCSAWLSEMEPPRGEVGPGQGEGAGDQVGPGQRQNSLWVFQMRNGTGISGPCVAALCVGWQESQVAGGTPGTSLSPQRLHTGKSLAKTPAALSRGRGAVKATYDSPLPLVWRHLSQLLCGHSRHIP